MTLISRPSSFAPFDSSLDIRPDEKQQHAIDMKARKSLIPGRSNTQNNVCF
jgi:hypothetical protein